MPQSGWMDAFKRASAKTITAVIPYYAYARQDRKTSGREAISAKLVADLLATAGAIAREMRGKIKERRVAKGISEQQIFINRGLVENE